MNNNYINFTLILLRFLEAAHNSIFLLKKQCQFQGRLWTPRCNNVQENMMNEIILQIFNNFIHACIFPRCEA